MNYQKCPWPWFGGKSKAAPSIWAALGDVAHYVEPFAGSLATLLLRPHPANRAYYSETVNDLDGFVCNFWRSVALSPDAVADAASWPVSEADLHARHLALLQWRGNQPLARLMGNPGWHDPLIAGFWAWGQSSWIGSGWCSGQGPWVVGEDGIFTKRPRTRGTEPGVSRKLPHIDDDGTGVNRPQAREPGVSRQLPHLGNDGKGVNRPQAREPGVKRQRPHIGNNGQGVNRPQAREPGVCAEHDWHPMTMPELREWMRFLGARLRHVRVLHGDWTRAVTTGAALTLPVRSGKSPAGVFLDPPYSGGVRDKALYACDSTDVATAVREWCLATGPDERYRIVLAGFSGEGHEVLVEHGWREVEWYTSGYLQGGMGNVGKGGQQKRERLWLSPHCLAAETP